MKKTTKILSGTLLVALMSLGLATKVNARKTNLEVRDVLTQDMTKPVTGKIVRRAADEEAANKISAVKAQVSGETEGRRHIRFVVGLDSTAYADVKFDILAKDGVATVKRFTNLSVTSAYTHIEAAGEVLAAADVFGDDYNYLVAYTINNVPESAWGYTFEVTVSSKTAEDGEYTTSEVASKVINEVAEKDEVAGVTIDATNLLKEDYNIEAIRDSEELYEGTTNAKLLIGDVDEGKVYSGASASLEKQYDLKDAKISFYAKMDANIYKERITIAIQNGEQYQLKIVLTAGNGTGYTVEPFGNNWFYVEIDVNKAWPSISYMSDTIYLVYANQDTTAAARMVIADLKVSGLVEVQKPNTGFTGHDYSDDLSVNYGCELSDDASVSVDGVKSKYVELTDLLDEKGNKATGGVAFYPDSNLAGQNLSFYVKLVDGLHYKNRVTIQLRDETKAQNIEVKVEIGTTAPAGVTYEALEDGWFHIVLDCDSVDLKGLDTHMVRIIFCNINNPTQPAAAWIDQININAK